MRISDWSSDVSSSDLCDQLILESKVAAMVDEAAGRGNGRDRRHDDVLQVAKAPGDSRQDGLRPAQVGEQRRPALHAKARLVGRAQIEAVGFMEKTADEDPSATHAHAARQLRRASWRERLCPYVYIAVVAVALQTP